MEINPHTFPRGIEPRGKDFITPIHTRSKLRGILGRCGDKSCIKKRGGSEFSDPPVEYSDPYFLGGTTGTGMVGVPGAGAAAADGVVTAAAVSL